MTTKVKRFNVGLYLSVMPTDVLGFQISIKCRIVSVSCHCLILKISFWCKSKHIMHGSENLGKSWRILADFGRSWQILANLDEFWRQCSAAMPTVKARPDKARSGGCHAGPCLGQCHAVISSSNPTRSSKIVSCWALSGLSWLRSYYWRARRRCPARVLSWLWSY